MASITEFKLQETFSGQMTEKLSKAFPAFQLKNYRWYFTGQLISLIGTWLQVVAEGWLIWELTKSPFWVGAIVALASLPSFLFSLFSGVLVDKFNKKIILYIVSVCTMILVFIYGTLVSLHIITIYEVAVIAFFLGICQAVELPARLSFVTEMVGKDRLASAIAINSAMFNGARIIGPSFAGILIGIIGLGGTYLLNGLSYIPAIFTLMMIHVPVAKPKVHPNPFHAIKEGLSYSYHHSAIKILLFLTAVTNIFGWSYTTLLPVIVERRFHETATTLGYFYAASGIGALLGASLVSIYASKMSSTRIILGGNYIFTIALILFSFTSALPLAFITLFFIGLGLVMQMSMINTTLQHMTDDHMRGRVLSLYSLAMVGLTPIGSLQIGYIAEHFSSGLAILIGGILVLVSGLYLYTIRKKMTGEYHEQITHEINFEEFEGGESS